MNRNNYRVILEIIITYISYLNMYTSKIYHKNNK